MDHFLLLEHAVNILFHIAGENSFDLDLASERRRQARSHFKCGRTNLAEGNYSEAETYFGAASRLDPDNLSNCFKEKSEREAVIHELELALVSKPELQNTRVILNSLRGSRRL